MNTNVLNNFVKYPIRLWCILKNHEQLEVPTMKAVRKHATDSGIIIHTRLFDSSKYLHDRDDIERLPAFHLYINKLYTDTFYLDNKPYEIIDRAVQAQQVPVHPRKPNTKRWALRNLAIFH